jgi:hypothetical protein
VAAKAQVFKVIGAGIASLISPGQIDRIDPKKCPGRWPLLLSPVRAVVNEVAEHALAPLVRTLSTNLAVSQASDTKVFGLFISMAHRTQGSGIMAEILSKEIQILPSVKSIVARGAGHLAGAV